MMATGTTTAMMKRRRWTGMRMTMEILMTLTGSDEGRTCMKNNDGLKNGNDENQGDDSLGKNERIILTTMLTRRTTG